MKRSILLPLGATALLLSSLTGSQASSGGGNLAIPGNTDIRALEPPVDIRPQQLEAQGYPRPYVIGIPQDEPLVVPLRRHQRTSWRHVRHRYY